ncbi:ABC transporter permease [Fervidibacillus halotolerans]|uniref:Iron ABC transporter permease n=1 Tax=Fervidibacillus halotolerans TaxID=2980027 RepID=A0A9E8M064_9BACI|nr:iron ABC transporter permease [Fervidibacillus halotolerans]WAA12771.1 iron ABC transporter permease [Fervidibacillus halotolerans]
MKNTLYIVSGSTVISLIVGITLAWVMAYLNIGGKKWIQLFIFLPFIIPSYITTLAWIQLFSENGPVASILEIFPGDWKLPNLYSMTGIIVILGLSHYPLVYLLSVELFRKIPIELEHAAQICGAKKGKIMYKVVLPLAIPGISSGGILAFLSNLDNFGIPAILGIPANIRVLSTYIYEEVVGFGPASFSRAAVLSILLGGIAFIGLLIQWLLLRKSRVIETVNRVTEPRIQLSSMKKRFIEIIIWSFLLLTSFVPFLSMGMTSLIKAYGLPFHLENLSFKNYEYILFTDSKTISALTNSLKLALLTTVVSLIIGTTIAYIRYKLPNKWTKLVELLITIPYALPGTVFALSMIFTWMQPIPGWNPGIYGSIWILIIAYITRFLVLQVRGSYTALTQIESSIEEAARTSGAKFFVKWRKILMPLLLPGVISGALLVFLTSLTELTVSSLLWSTGAETVGVVIFNFEQAGYTLYSTAFSSLIVLAILLLGIFLIFFEKIWRRKVLKQVDSA